ncbi:hypothetical protein E4H12_11455 [Candidatus Thorarchaeota archaeon]|nr:MAG: hypothetical protein E4H12_11455 [Candidatus Thorarchaeota archaeon]
MKLYEILTERFVNLVSPQQREPYANVVWDMIRDTYSNHTSGLGSGTNISDLLRTPGIWKLAVRDNDVKGGAIYREHRGRKLRLVFHDGTSEGKIEMKRVMTDDIARGRAWGEFSGPLEKVMLQLGGKPVPNDLASKILGKPIAKLDTDGFHYWRSVGGNKFKREIIIGNPHTY